MAAGRGDGICNILVLMRATRWIIVSLALGIFSVADAQDGQPVCPLSESQQTKAVEAFAKLLPIFGEPRCFNCHGGVSPFNKGRGTHPEFGFKVVCKDGSLGPCDRGSPENFEATFGECQSCHSEITGGEPPRWRLAPAPAMQWNLTGTSKEKPGIELCRQQKHLFAGDGPRFIRHMRNDDGGVQFIQAAYAGRRALNKEAEDRADIKSVFPDPPRSMTRAQMSERALKWVDAMNGGMPEPEECGCVEMQYALQVQFRGSWRPPTPGGFIGFDWNSLPTLIPLHFQDSGAISGAGAVPNASSGTIEGPHLECGVAGNQTIGVVVSGNWPALTSSQAQASGVESDRMQIRFDASGLANSTQGQCNGFPGSSTQTGPGVYTFNFSLDPVVGVTQSAPWNFPLPGFLGLAQVTLVRTK